MSHDKDFERWLKKVMSKVIENLGSNIEEARYELSESTDGLFMSSFHYVCVKFKNKAKEGRNEELFLVLKRPTLLEANRKTFPIDPQFHNEILLYRNFVRPDENFAKCFYTDEQPPTDSVIVLENLSKRGYCPCPHDYNAPLEYILVAMREMGRFHGKGYVMKEQQREKFFDIVAQIQESKFSTEEKYTEKLIINSAATRSVDYLRNQGHDAVFCDKMEAVLSNAFETIMLETVKPVEPLSTLCHGDFTLSNTVFKMENDGQLRAILIDFALSRYATPVVDLSTFLHLACSNEIRKENFFEIVQAYHDTLKKYLLDAGIQDIDKYSYNAILDDYKRGALFGFVIASIFLATLMGYYDKDSSENATKIDPMKYAETRKQAGGEKVSKILADMLLQLRDIGCLKHIV